MDDAIPTPTRRQALKFGALTIIATGSGISIGRSEEGGEVGDEIDTSAPTNVLVWSSDWDQQQTVYLNGELGYKPGNTDEQLGAQYRAPGMAQSHLDDMQQLSTNTPTASPGPSAVAPGGYFSDNANYKFFSNSDIFTSASENIVGSGQYHLFVKPVELHGNESIDANIRRVVDAGTPYAVSVLNAIQLMRNSGEWNYKRTYGPSGKDAGDFNYGVVSAALGIPEDAALRFAGWYAENHGTHFPGHWYDRSGSYGHDPHAQEIITQGYEYYYHKELIDFMYRGAPSENRYQLIPSSELHFDSN